MSLSAAHWIYLAGIILILVTMGMRRNVVVPAVAFTFLTALAFSGNFVTALASVFNGSLVAAQNLFSIFLVIALVTAMLGGLRAMGADVRMITPFRGVMRNGHVAFWVLAGVTYVISLFFWPTPAVPLIGAVLIPVAIRAGLPPLAVGMAVACAGQGMALSSDYIIRVAPGLSAQAAGVNATVVADRAIVLSLITGVIALVIAYFMQARAIRRPSMNNLVAWERDCSVEEVEAEQREAAAKGTFHDQGALAVAPVATAARAEGGPATTVGGTDAGTRIMDSGEGGAAVADRPGGDGHGMSSGGDRLRPDTGGGGEGSNGPPSDGGPSGDGQGGSPGASIQDRRIALAFAAIVPLAYLGLVAYMVASKVSPALTPLEGGDAAALVGGIAAMLLLFAALVKDRAEFLDTCATHVVDGLVFAFKAMGVVIPIAGFFFIGSADFAGGVLGLPEDAEAPSLLFDLVHAGQNQIPQSGFLTAFGILLIGMIAGLDGSGFSGLPLTGSLAGSLGSVVGMDPATLAAVGQMGNIWAGGGTLVAWSSLIAVAGFARVSALELARKCFIPVVTGLIVSTLVAVIFFG